MSYANALNPETDFGRKSIVFAAEQKAYHTLEADYPHAVYRDPQGAAKAAEYAYTAWLNNDVLDIRYATDWAKWLPEIKRLFTATFAGEYLDRIAKRDKNTGRSSAVQPATPAKNPTMQGVSVSLLKVERSGSEYVYTIRIDDPNLQHPIIRELEFDSTKLQPWKSEWGMAADDISRYKKP